MLLCSFLESRTYYVRVTYGAKRSLRFWFFSAQFVMWRKDQCILLWRSFWALSNELLFVRFWWHGRKTWIYELLLMYEILSFFLWSLPYIFTYQSIDHFTLHRGLGHRYPLKSGYENVHVKMGLPYPVTQIDPPESGTIFRLVSAILCCNLAISCS